MEPLHSYYQNKEKRNMELVECMCWAIKLSALIELCYLAYLGMLSLRGEL